MMSSLPILDMSRLDGGEDEASAFRDELRRATHEVGFFYLVGHGVSAELTERLIAASRAFFELSDEDKLSIENVHSAQFRGYTRVGGELTHGQVDWREQIDVGPERATVSSLDEDYWRLEGPNLWPAALPEIRDIVIEWEDQLNAIALRLMQTWAEALGSPADVFDAAFGDHPFSLLKIVRYPGESDESTPKQGVGEHRDGGVLTLLLVEPGKGGLQVEHEGEWIDAPSVPGAFVVNIGEMLELATDGYLKATLHRVQSPKIGTDRLSIPFFFNPALDATVPKLELPAELAAEVRGLSLDPNDSPILETYGDNALRYRLRAHPNVAAVHHADLI
jgi:isopenicillin N synthase-like dioxygenase